MSTDTTTGALDHGPYETETQASRAPLAVEVRGLHDSGRTLHGDADGPVAATKLRHLTEACEAAGIDLGTYDWRILRWLTTWEPATIQVVIGLIVRAATASQSEAALDRMAERLLADTRMRSMDFRNGVNMEIEPAREIAANFVAAARTMLGDAENYTETPIEMEMKLAGEVERFAFVVQRVGKLTPHQARRLAEERAEAAEAEVRRLRAELTERDASPPTQWAYDRAVAALEKHRARADAAEEQCDDYATKETDNELRLLAAQDEAAALREELAEANRQLAVLGSRGDDGQ